MDGWVFDMSQICIRPPTVLAVTMEQAKRNLRVDDDDLDDLIGEVWLPGIISALEHEIGQCLMEQTWEVTVDGVSDTIRLPHPVISIESVTYLDVDGVRQELAPSTWRLSRSRYWTVMSIVAGSCWPATAVTVRLVCGYGSTAANTPANIRLYILAKLVEQYDPNTRAERDTVQSNFVTRLLDACRTYE